MENKEYVMEKNNKASTKEIEGVLLFQESKSLYLQKYVMLNIVLIIFLFTLKLFDIFITVIALFFGAEEQNLLGVFFYENPVIISVISFVPIIILLVALIFFKQSPFGLKVICVSSIFSDVLLFSIVISNLTQLMVLL